MAEHTDIEWADATWNPVTGCSIASPGCRNCYAMHLAGSLLKHHRSRRNLTMPTGAGPVWTGRVRFNMQRLLDPLRWRKPKRILVCDDGDLFHAAVPFEWIDHVHAVMALAPRHTFQVVTKRSGRMWDYYNHLLDTWDRLIPAAETVLAKWGHDFSSPPFLLKATLPLPNVWLGVSVEDRDRAERIHDLKDTPAERRFVLFEPLLEDVRPLDLDGLDWAIVGGESGPHARPMDPYWVYSLRDHCHEQHVAFFLKQWGNPRAKNAGRLLDDVSHDALPERSDDGRFIPPFRPKTTIDRVLPEIDYGDLPF